MEDNKEFEVEDAVRSAQPEPEAQEPEVQPEISEETYEPEITAYRGAGAGRKESPFADSPYVMNHPPKAEAPYRSQYQSPDPDPQPAPKRKPKKGGLGRNILSWVLILALVAGSCAFTAHTVNKQWEDRASAMEAAFGSQLADLQKQMEAMSPASTGNSVSGTVALGEGMTAAQIYAKNVNAVVLIESKITAEVYGSMATGTSFGTGFVLTEDGYVVTNYHVVESASSVNVTFCDGQVHPAELVGYDSTNDVAVLKLEANGLDAVTLGSSDALIVGDQVVAIGNPLGELTSTLTVGYVSAKERTVDTDGTVINMIQTDAAINSGNSGGPLFNMKGEVVGITTAKYSGASSSGASIEGIGFAIPMDDVLGEIQELMEYGFIQSGYLGVLVQNMDASVAGIYGLPVGAYVAGVEDGFCAQKAGIRAKDIIVAVGDTPVESINDLTRALRDYDPGDKAKLIVYRAGQYLELLVVLDARPAD